MEFFFGIYFHLSVGDRFVSILFIKVLCHLKGLRKSRGQNHGVRSAGFYFCSIG